MADGAALPREAGPGLALWLGSAQAFGGMAVRLGWLAATTVVAFVACGGDQSDAGLFGGKAGAGGTAGGSAATGGGAAGSGAVGSGGIGGMGGFAGSTAGTGATDGGGGTPDGGGGVTGGTGGTSAGGSGGTGPSGGAGGTGGVAAGTGPCFGAICAFVAGDTCCKGDGMTPYCSNESLGNPCTCKGIGCNTLEISCDGPEDCEGAKICCAETGFLGGQYDIVECRETCKSDPIGSKRREICHAGGKPCLNGTACAADAQLPPGYATCGP